MPVVIYIDCWLAECRGGGAEGIPLASHDRLGLFNFMKYHYGAVPSPFHLSCVGSDIIRPLIYINNNLSSFLFYCHAEADIVRQWEGAAVEYFKIAEIFCVQLVGGHIFIYKIAGV